MMAITGSRMWTTSLLTMMLLFPLPSAAPLDIAGGVEDDNDGLHSHDENVTRLGKYFGHNQFDFSVSDENVTRRGKSFDHNEFDFSVSVEGNVGSIGHEVNIDVHDGHTDDHHHHEDDTVIECKEELRELFKSIDSNKNGLMDARELLRVCHHYNFQVTESSAVRILTLPDKTVGFNLAKFCELLKDCPSTNSVDLIYFLLELFDKVKNPGRLCQKRIISSSVCSFLPLICPGLHLKSNCTLLDLKLHVGVTCPHKDDPSDVLLENNWRTQNQINAMSENMQRNTVIIEVEKMTGHTIEDLRGRANAGDFGSLTAIANMAGLLIKDSNKSSSDVETLAYSDLRNTLIAEASQRFSMEVSILHSMTDRQLLKTFCTANGGCTRSSMETTWRILSIPKGTAAPTRRWTILQPCHFCRSLENTWPVSRRLRTNAPLQFTSLEIKLPLLTVSALTQRSSCVAEVLLSSFLLLLGQVLIRTSSKMMLSTSFHIQETEMSIKIGQGAHLA